MYLTLTKIDREAIDRVGNDLPHGLHLQTLLSRASWEGETGDDIYNWAESVSDITVSMGDSTARDVATLLRYSQLNGFSEDLTTKLHEFVEHVGSYNEELEVKNSPNYGLYLEE